MSEQAIAIAVSVLVIAPLLILMFIGLVALVIKAIEEERRSYYRAQRLAMVETARQHLVTMERAERQAEYKLMMVTAFSLYVGERFAQSLLLLESLVPDFEALTPEVRVQIDQRLDEFERNLDRIEDRTALTIIHLR